MKTTNAVMDVTVQTDVHIVDVKKSVTGKHIVLLEIEGRRSWHHAGDKVVVTLSSRTERKGN